MFEVGWTEMLVIAIVMIVVVGPKDLPSMLRTFGRTVAKLRSMAGDFQKQFNDALKEAELDDVKKSVDALRGLNPASEIRKQLNPFEKAAADVRSGIDNVMKPKPAADPAPSANTEATPAEPLKPSSDAPVAGAADASPAFPAMADPSVVAAPAQASVAKKTVKRTASKPAAQKASPVKVAAAKAEPAKPTPAKVAVAKAPTTKAVPAKAASTKTAPPKAARKASEKAPAATRKKTAGAAK